MSCSPASPSASSQLKLAFAQVDCRPNDEVRQAYQSLFQANTGRPHMEDCSITQHLPGSYRHAQLESRENAIRERVGLRPIWSQPLNQRTIQVLRDVGIGCAIPAEIITQLVRGDWLALMGTRVGEYLREHNGELQLLKYHLTLGSFWTRCTMWDLRRPQCLTERGAMFGRRDSRDATLWEAPVDVQQPQFPAPLQSPEGSHTYVGLWAFDMPNFSIRRIRQGGLHQGLLFVEKREGSVKPSVSVAGFQGQDDRTVLKPLDDALRPLAAGRRTASSALYEVGSLELLHRIEVLLKQADYPVSIQTTREDQAADRLVRPLWQLPVEKRFPALVHLLITSTAGNSRCLMQAFKRVCKRPLQDIPPALDARAVIALALELVESTYTHFDGNGITCRFLAKRVMRVADALLDLRPAAELHGHTIAAIRIQRSARLAIAARLLLWLSDILGWFAERWAKRQPLPTRLAWTAPLVGDASNP